MSMQFHSNPCWETAYAYVQEGKSKVTRPAYHRNMSLRIVEPDNPQSDITLNGRWRHLGYDPVAIKRIKWLTTADAVNYQESLTAPPGEFEWRDLYRMPVLTYKYPNLITVDHSQATMYGACKTIRYFTGLRDLMRRGDVVKIGQATDTAYIPKSNKKCRRCHGDKWMLFTYWAGHGVSEEDVTAYNLNYEELRISHSFDLNELDKPTQIVKMACPNCAGSGLQTSRWQRWNMTQWTSGEIVIDSNTRLLIPQEGGTCT